VVLIGAILLATAGVLALVFGARQGDSAVATLGSPAQRSLARVENDYYRCLDVQTRSLVAPGQPVSVAQQGNVADLLRAIGSWITAAPPRDHQAPQLALVSRTGPGTCHGSVVVARFPGRDGRPVERVGSGASQPGQGPLPRPPL
jgi:hypothetical protein